VPANIQQIWYLGINLILSAAFLLWWYRKHHGTDTSGKARDTGWGLAIPLLGAGALMIGMGLWNGPTIYMADESIYLLGANHLSHLQWSEEFPPVGNGEGEIRKEDVGVLYMAFGKNRMYAMYPPGWPLILAAMQQVMPLQLVVPVIGIGILLLLWQYGKRFLPPGATEGTLWILGLSVAFLLNCVGFTSHPSACLLLFGAAFFTERSLKTGMWRDALAAMLFCAAAAAGRPLPGALGFAVSGFFLWRHFGWKKVAWLVLAAAAVIIPLQIAQNVYTTGLWARSEYNNIMMRAPAHFTYGLPVIKLQAARIAHTIACMFPLTFALVAIALLEKNSRKRSFVYVAIWAIEVIAHTIMPMDSDSPVGERYFLEAMPYLAMAAGMGWAHVAAVAGPQRLWAMRAGAVLLALVPLYNLSLHHHELRRTHALLLAKKEELGRDADLVFLVRSTVLRAENYWINPVPWNSAKTVFWRTPRNESKEVVAQKLGRRKWKEVRLDTGTGQFVETARSNP